MNNINNREENIDNTDISISELTFPIGKQLFILGVLLLFVFSAGYIHQYFTNKEISVDDLRKNQSKIKHTQKIRTTDNKDFFSQAQINARSAFVLDVKTQKVLYMKDPDLELPLASITKLMTVLVANEILEKSSTVVINEKAIKQEGDSNLSVDELFNFEDLTDLTLVTSSNDGAFAIASAAGNLLTSDNPSQTFVEAMNIRSLELGLTKTHFNNPTGLDISKKISGGYGSARDIAYLFEYLLLHYPQVLEKTKDEYSLIYNKNGAFHEAENTNNYVSKISGILGSKTGYTDLAGGNLALAFNAGLDRPIIIVVLGSGKNTRFTDVELLVDSTKKQLSLYSNNNCFFLWASNHTSCI